MKPSDRLPNYGRYYSRISRPLKSLMTLKEQSLLTMLLMGLHLKTPIFLYTSSCKNGSNICKVSFSFCRFFSILLHADIADWWLGGVYHFWRSSRCCWIPRSKPACSPLRILPQSSDRRSILLTNASHLARFISDLRLSLRQCGSCLSPELSYSIITGCKSSLSLAMAPFALCTSDVSFPPRCFLGTSTVWSLLMGRLYAQFFDFRMVGSTYVTEDKQMVSNLTMAILALLTSLPH